MTIKILDSNTINQIAAGEVLERPYAAVKELIENSLDAEASKVDIVIENGGKSYICVSDNGCGIEKEELPLSLMRHATSKLPDEDLQHINFFGFRGEALPSMAAVSRVSITSRTANSDSAYAIKASGKDISDVFPAALSCGTKVEVRDMFFATPARLKFLKSDVTETGKIEEIVKHIAMANPLVTFTLTEGKREKLRYMAGTDVNKAFQNRFEDIFGSGFRDNFASVDEKDGDISLKGFISLPTYTKMKSLSQYLFINGRPIKDRLVLGAVKAAYSGLIASDRYPVVALFISMPSSLVDVNVHPAKTEVRFKDYGQVRNLIVTALRNTLSKESSKVAGIISQNTLKSFSYRSTPYSARPSETDKKFNYQYSFNPSNNQNSVSRVPNLAEQFYDNIEVTKHEKADIGSNLLQLNEGYSAFNYCDDATAQSDDMKEDDFPPLGLARGQLHRTYIVSQTKEGIVIVDQHAAHERLTYEKIRKAEGIKESQMLLTPYLVDLPEKSVENLLRYKKEMEDLGLALDSFGEETVVVRAVPAILKDTDITKLINDISDTVEDFSGALSLEEKIKNICATMACHNSVRAGRTLNTAEMNALLRQMEQVQNSAQCIHGRPTYVELKLKDIERLFGRR